MSTYFRKFCRLKKNFTSDNFPCDFPQKYDFSSGKISYDVLLVIVSKFQHLTSNFIFYPFFYPKYVHVRFLLKRHAIFQLIKCLSPLKCQQKFLPPRKIEKVPPKIAVMKICPSFPHEMYASGFFDKIHTRNCSIGLYVQFIPMLAYPIQHIGVDFVDSPGTCPGETLMHVSVFTNFYPQYFGVRTQYF